MRLWMFTRITTQTILILVLGSWVTGVGELDGPSQFSPVSGFISVTIPAHRRTNEMFKIVSLIPRHCLLDNAEEQEKGSWARTYMHSIHTVTTTVQLFYKSLLDNCTIVLQEWFCVTTNWIPNQFDRQLLPPPPRYCLLPIDVLVAHVLGLDLDIRLLLYLILYLLLTSYNFPSFLFNPTG